MSVLGQVQKFLSDLVQGDFSQEPSSASIVVNGAIGLIPIVDQVLDARDVTAQVIICSQKGWGNLQEDDYANLAFTAIGLVPTFGSFFKGAVKPLWRERKLVGRGVQSGLAMLERALGMGKGGVVKWVNTINWAQRTEQAASAAQTALDSYIGMLEAIAQDPWWAPHGLVVLAKNQIPVAKQSKVWVSQAIERGAKLIENFLKDLLGEHAVWVQVAARAAQTSVKTNQAAVSASKIVDKADRTASDQRKSPSTDKNKSLHGHKHQEVSGDKKIDAKAQSTPVSAVQQSTRKIIQEIGSSHRGLVGEHMVDYHVLRQQEQAYSHASFQAMTKTDKLYKVNHEDNRPIELCAGDLGNVNKHGIDSLWQLAGAEKYLVVEAKARTKAKQSGVKKDKAAKAHNSSKQAALDKGQETEQAWMSTLSADQKILAGALSDTSDKGRYGAVMMQMSRDWIHKAASVSGKGSPEKAKTINLRDWKKYERQVHIVSIEPKLANGLAEHISCVMSAVGQGASYEHEGKHETHGVSYSFFETDIAKVEKSRSTRASPKAAQEPKDGKEKTRRIRTERKR